MICGAFAVAAAPAIAVDLAQPHLMWHWGLIGQGAGHRGLEIVDVDGDGASEIFASESNGSYWFELEYGETLRQRWASLPLESGLVSISVSAYPNRVIAALSPDAVVVYDPATKVELKRFQTASIDSKAIIVADLDGAGVLEAIVCDEANLYRYELLTGLLTTTKYGFGCSRLDIGQIDGDPQLEIALAGNVSGGFVLDGSSLEVDWADVRGFGSMVALGDLDGDGRDEVVSGEEAGVFARAQDPETGALLWAREAAGLTDVEVADVHESAGAEVLWGNSSEDRLEILKGSTGQEIFGVSSPQAYFVAIAAGDADGDGDSEILWGAGECCTAPVAISAIDGGSSVVTAVAPMMDGFVAGYDIGDFSGSGEPEVVASAGAGNWNYSSGRAWMFGLNDSRLSRSSAVLGEGNLLQLSAPAGGQIDGDPGEEICLSIGAVATCLDGLTLTAEWSVEFSESTPGTLIFSEIDDDLSPELLVARTPGILSAMEGESGGILWESAAHEELFRFATLWNFDDDPDGPPRVVGATPSSYYTGVGLETFDAQTGNSLSGFQAVLFNAIASRGDVESHDTELFVSLDGGEIRRIDPMTGELGAIVASTSQTLSSFAFVDFDRDGVEDIVSAAADGRIRLVEGTSGAVAWTSPFLGIGLGDIRAGDFDGNGVPEVLARSLFGIVRFEGPLFELFADGFESGDTSAWNTVNP